jgi:hypothetical protein
VEGSPEKGKTRRKATTGAGCGERGLEKEPCPQWEDSKTRSPRSGGGDIAGDEQDNDSGGGRRW